MFNFKFNQLPSYLIISVTEPTPHTLVPCVRKVKDLSWNRKNVEKKIEF